MDFPDLPSVWNIPPVVVCVAGSLLGFRPQLYCLLSERPSLTASLKHPNCPAHPRLPSPTILSHFLVLTVRHGLIWFAFCAALHHLTRESLLEAGLLSVLLTAMFPGSPKVPGTQLAANRQLVKKC